MFTSEYSDRFTLICTHFAYVSALWGPLRGPSHLFDPFLILCIYFYIVLVCVWSTVGESTSFSVLGSFIISSFRIRSEKARILLVTIFLIQLIIIIKIITKKKKQTNSFKIKQATDN
jgi:hypothetical protein